MLSVRPNTKAAERFFRNVLRASHTAPLSVITVDNNAAYPPAFDVLRQARTLPETCLLRQCKYLSNMVAQMVEWDYRPVKCCVNPRLGFGAFPTAHWTIQGYEAMHMIRKGQLEGIAKRDVLAQNRVINQMSGVAA